MTKPTINKGLSSDNDQSAGVLPITTNGGKDIIDETAQTRGLRGSQNERLPITRRRIY